MHGPGLGTKRNGVSYGTSSIETTLFSDKGKQGLGVLMDLQNKFYRSINFID